MLESYGNLRPTTASKPKNESNRVSLQKNKITNCTTFTSPRPRLRMAEAFENAKRNHQTHIFVDAEITSTHLNWKKTPHMNIENDEDAQNVSVAQLMKSYNTPTQSYQPSRIHLRGEDSLNNQIRGQGSLTLKQITKDESQKAVTEQMHVRCTGEQALDNRLLGQRGTGVGILLDYKQTEEPFSLTGSSKRAVITNEATENWRRDRLKECGEMEGVLNQGWNSRNVLTNALSTSKLKSIEPDTVMPGPLDTLWGPSSRKTDVRPRTVGLRGVSHSGVAYALREGSAMAERFGLQRSVKLVPNCDPYEVSQVQAQATQSSDMRPDRIGLKVKREGIENAIRNRGTLNTGLIPSVTSDLEINSASRLRGDAHEIANANRGASSKLLLSNWCLSAERLPPRRPITNSKNIRERSRGAEAGSCLNPTHPKWSGKVRWKRRPQAVVKCTF